MRRAASLLLLPSGVWLGVFMLVPFAILVLISFYTYSPTAIASPPLTTSNYERLADTYYLGVFLRTMRIGLYVTFLTAIFAVPTAYLLARASQRNRAVGLFLILTPLMVSAVIRAFGWIVILGREGLVNNTFGLFGYGPYRLVGNETAVLIGMVQLLLPFMVLPLMSAIEKIPRNLEEAAMSLGASWYQAFAKVVVPLSLPGLISGALLTYTLSVSALVIPALMGGQRVRMLGQQIYDEILQTFNWPGGAAMAVVLVLVTTVLLLTSFLAADRLGRIRSGR